MKDRIVPMEWESEFLPWFKSRWEPGQHVGLIAPTGAGKTTLASGILDHCRKYVLALDAKGGDTTLATLGYPRLDRWPGMKRISSMVEENEKNNLPSRWIVGSSNRTLDEAQKLITVLKTTLDDAWSMGNWTLYADELQLLTDPRLMGLREEVDRLLIAARDRGISFMASFQAPKWVSPTAYQQASHLAVSYTQDDDVVKRLAEVLGRDKNEVRGVFKGLDKFAWVIVGRDPREPYRVTIPARR